MRRGFATNPHVKPKVGFCLSTLTAKILEDQTAFPKRARPRPRHAPWRASNMLMPKTADAVVSTGHRCPRQSIILLRHTAARAVSRCAGAAGTRTTRLPVKSLERGPRAIRQLARCQRWNPTSVPCDHACDGSPAEDPGRLSAQGRWQAHRDAPNADAGLCGRDRGRARPDSR